MGSCIRAYRILALFFWAFIPPLLALPYLFRKDRQAIYRINQLVRFWGQGVARIVNLRVTVSGPVPGESGGLLVSNHLGYLDIVTHGSILPLRYTPKNDIMRWPFLGWYVGLCRPIWIDRRSRQASKKALRDYVKTMNRGMYLLVYPEGTSTDGKQGVLPFKSTSFDAAITAHAPIIPVITRYREVPGEPTVCWYGTMTFLPHVWRLLSLPRIEAEVRFLDPIDPCGKSRKELASLAHEVISREYAKS